MTKQKTLPACAVDNKSKICYNTSMTTHYYFAYGMNTNNEEMRSRCPSATDLGRAELLNYKMVFKYYCDVVEQPGHDAPGVLWRLTDECLQALDRLEGYPVFYDRKYAQVRHGDVIVNALVYYMVDGSEPDLPPLRYYDTVLQGYNSHGISEKPLLDGLPEEAYTV